MSGTCSTDATLCVVNSTCLNNICVCNEGFEGNALILCELKHFQYLEEVLIIVLVSFFVFLIILLIILLRQKYVRDKNKTVDPYDIDWRKMFNGMRNASRVQKPDVELAKTTGELEEYSPQVSLKGSVKNATTSDDNLDYLEASQINESYITPSDKNYDYQIEPDLIKAQKARLKNIQSALVTAEEGDGVDELENMEIYTTTTEYDNNFTLFPPDDANNGYDNPVFIDRTSDDVTDGYDNPVFIDHTSSNPLKPKEGKYEIEEEIQLTSFKKLDSPTGSVNDIEESNLQVPKVIKKPVRGYSSKDSFKEIKTAPKVAPKPKVITKPKVASPPDTPPSAAPLTQESQTNF